MPEPTLWLWLITLLSSLVASTVTTVTGVGAGLILYGALSFFMDLKVIIPLAAPAQLLSTGLRAWLFWPYIRWRLAGYLFLGVLPGIYAGTLLFEVLTEQLLRRLLGVFLLGFAAYELFQKRAQRRVPHLAWLPFGGFWSGVLLGSIGVPGPLLALIFLRYGLLKEDLVAMITLFFLVGNAQRTLLYWQQQTLLRESLGLAAAIGVMMLGGVYLGRLILPHVSRALFVKLVLGMLVLFGVQFLIG